jgi:hypothetical protein
VAAEANRQPGFVENHYAGHLLVAIEGGKQLEGGDLVVQIKVRERLVEQVELRRLRQQGGNGQPLPLATRKRLHVALREFGQTDRGQRLTGFSGIGVGLPIPAIEMGMASDQCRFEDRRGERLAAALRQPAPNAGATPRAELGVAAPGEADLARIRRAQTGQHREQGRLPGTVAAENGQRLTRSYAQRQIAAESAASDADAKATGEQHRLRVIHLSRARPRRASAGREKRARRSAP